MTLMPGRTMLQGRFALIVIDAEGREYIRMPAMRVADITGAVLRDPFPSDGGATCILAIQAPPDPYATRDSSAPGDD